MISVEEVKKLKKGSRVFYKDPSPQSKVVEVMVFHTLAVTNTIVFGKYPVQEPEDIKASTLEEFAENVLTKEDLKTYYIETDNYLSSKESIVKVLTSATFHELRRFIEDCNTAVGRDAKLRFFPIPLERWVEEILDQAFDNDFSSGFVFIPELIAKIVLMVKERKISYIYDCEDAIDVNELRISGDFYHDDSCLLLDKEDRVLSDEEMTDLSSRIGGRYLSMKVMREELKLSDKFILDAIKNPDYMKYRIIKELIL